MAVICSAAGGKQANMGLGRTFDPKYTHYGPDGGGRDTYILHLNGGLSPNKPLILPMAE